MDRYVTESIGSFFLVLALGLAASPIAVGFILSALYAIGYRISGAHFNPAISFVFLLRKEIHTSEFNIYVISQLLGAFAAAGLVWYMGSQPFYVEPPLDTTIYQQLLVECLFTALLALVYLSLAGSSFRKDLATSALLVGFTYAGIVSIGQSISSGIFNPAVSIGTSIVDLLAIRGQSYEYVPLFVLAPLAGAILAALADRFIRGGQPTRSSRK
jgi:glycerol uptake facilitator-like aquaporin